MSVVALAKQEDYSASEVELKLEKILSASGILDKVSHKKILIKPNITGSFSPLQSRTTHPQVFKSLIEIFQEHNALVIIGESSSIGTDTMEAAKISGIAAVAEETHTHFIDFKQSRYQEVKIPHGLILDTIHLPQEVLSADYIISLAKMKTNYVSTISCSVKNMKGILQDSEKRKCHHLGLSEAVADLISYFDNVFAVVDGIVGSELYEPIQSNVLVASKDPLAADSVCAKIMGLDPNSIGHLRLAYQKRTTSSEIELKGDLLSSVLTNFQHTSLGAKQLGEKFGVQITEGQYCSSCLGSLYLCLKKTQQHHPELLSGINRINGINIVLGKYSGEASKNDVYFGNCAAQKDRNFVSGCVPITFDFMDYLKNRIGNY